MEYLLKRNLFPGVVVQWDGATVKVVANGTLLEEHDACDLRTATVLMAEIEDAYHGACWAMA